MIEVRALNTRADFVGRKVRVEPQIFGCFFFAALLKPVAQFMVKI